jgi:hypothetical protein
VDHVAVLNDILDGAGLTLGIVDFHDRLVHFRIEEGAFRTDLVNAEALEPLRQQARSCAHALEQRAVR